MYDITDSKLRIDTLHELAYRDPLTGAENRRAFMEKLEAEFQRTQRTGNAAALIMLDIDHFKLVNDTYGHDVGDLVLKHLVSVLQGGLRRIDTLGRIGGEEFAVLLPETTLVAATELAERLRALVASQQASAPGKQTRRCTKQSIRGATGCAWQKLKHTWPHRLTALHRCIESAPG